ncbi:hypothetical protein Sjap_014967 [Stephania japonica]|uniref:Uncharacterized protein n=1 Tax=Stephania japonica TaxID=461633 RepID=A0AAP0NSF0_9MAGN
MERFFGNAYRGDPGVPHTDPERFVNIWIGSFAFSAITWFHPYMWQLSNQYNWHDRAMLFEQYHWKKALKKRQPYKFMTMFKYALWHYASTLEIIHNLLAIAWNEYMDKDVRDSYYFNWPVYFP